MLLPEILREGLGGLQTALGLGALLVDQAEDHFFHRHADPSGFASEPGFVAGINVADGDAGIHFAGSGSVDWLLAGRLCLQIMTAQHLGQKSATAVLDHWHGAGAGRTRLR